MFLKYFTDYNFDVKCSLSAAVIYTFKLFTLVVVTFTLPAFKMSSSRTDL